MKKVRKIQPFNGSRTPSREGITQVFLADPNALTTFGKSITKEEFGHSIHIYNKILELEKKKRMFRDMLYFVLIMIPFIFFFYNITIGVSR